MARWYFYDLLQDCSDLSALAMELLQSCIKPSIYSWFRIVNDVEDMTQIEPLQKHSVWSKPLINKKMMR